MPFPEADQAFSFQAEILFNDRIIGLGKFYWNIITKDMLHGVLFVGSLTINIAYYAPLKGQLLGIM